MRVVALGKRSFVAGLRLAGINGVEVASPEETLDQLNGLLAAKDVGLVLLSDDVAKPIRTRLTEIRAKRPVPLLYEIPTPGSKAERVEYRDMLKQILGV